MYLVFQYPAIQLARNMKLDWLGESAAAALLGTLIYHPYDIVGAKYVWWMWHRDDPIMLASEVGVPCASTFWTMAYTGALAVTFRYVSNRWGQMSATSTAALVAPVASLGLMNVPFTFIYQPLVLGCGVSEINVLNGFRAFCLFLVAWARLSRTAERKIEPENILLLVVPLLCLTALTVIVTNFDPADVQRHGLFQTFGSCEDRESAYFGWKDRSKFNCQEVSGRNAGLWDFRCVTSLPNAGDKWYTVCPTAFPAGWHNVFGMHLAFGVAFVIIAYVI
jgi:hypothetical protein